MNSLRDYALICMAVKWLWDAEAQALDATTTVSALATVSQLTKL
jgi:hypothetical protein